MDDYSMKLWEEQIKIQNQLEPLKKIYNTLLEDADVKRQNLSEEIYKTIPDIENLIEDLRKIGMLIEEINNCDGNYKVKKL